MKVLFTLCGRAGSKGVKGKNARDFLDVPLAWYSLAGITLYIEKYGKEGDLFDVVVNTDSEDLMRIVDASKGVNVTKLWRDVNLGGDKVSKVAVIYDCLNRAVEQFGHDYDMVVDLDITSPLRSVQDVKNVIDRKASRQDVDAVFTVTHARRNPYFNMVKEENGYFCKAIPSTFTTRQEAPVFYDMNASIYAYSPEALRHKQHEVFFNDRCDAVIMDDSGILDIDSEEDYYLMQVIANYLFENVDKYKEIYTEILKWKE
ncbi:acylneuraminate cytidylyltransferase family protein [Parabacteroides sp.]|uniref:acylneuraminate cytidylyltransferase family protein n=1 Tax=Parabacteroides sp. TaxID=1869337 RepID=UPI00257D65C1|nr:acylneuraminate cytidylyltransferase family protein [Parabacteroides sp.]